MSKVNKHILFSFLMGVSVACFAQSSTNSPYTYYGIGEFENSDHSRTFGMGGVGIALKSSSFINYLNPASYSSIDSLNFVFDFAISGSMSRFESSSSKYNAINGNLKKIALGFRFNPKWAFSLGLTPYTNVGYKTSVNKEIEGLTETFNIASEGKGGISKLFIGNSFKLSEHVSVGVNSNILVGYIERSETYTYSNQLSGYWQKKSKLKPNTAISFDFGLQIADSISTKWNYILGFTGGVNTKLNMREYIAYESDTSTVATDEFVKNADFWIPAYGGVGLSLNSSKWILAADYKVQYWSSVSSKNNMSMLNNSHHFALGAQYTPSAMLGKSIFDRMSYQLGAHFDRSYLKINSENYDAYGVSAGVLIPIRNQRSSIGLSVDAGKKGRLSGGLFKENYLKVNLSMSLSDIWFQKHKYN